MLNKYTNKYNKKGSSEIKNNMKKILSIFKNDLKRLTKSKMAIVMLIGLAIIPGIYAWLNIDSNWNPYDNTGDLPIAIVNLDEGYTFVDKNVNMGNMLVESLKDNHDMKWIFTDETDAIEKVYKSEYYGAVIIPKEFTSKVATIVDDSEIQKPQCKFYVNEKKNPIAPIIVSKAATTLQTKLNESFVNAIVYNVMNEAESMDVVTKQAATTEDLIVNLNGAKKDIKELQATLNAIVLISNSASNVLQSVKDLLPALQNVSEDTQKSISNIRDVVNSFNNIFENTNDNIALIIETTKTLSDSLNNILSKLNTKEDVTEDLKAALEILNTLSKTLTEFSKILDSMDSSNIPLAGLDEIKKLTESTIKQVESLQKTIQNVLDKLSKNEEITSDMLNDLKNTSSELNKNLTKIQQDFEKNVIPSMNKAMQESSKALTSVSNVVSSLNVAMNKNDKVFDNLIQGLNNTEAIAQNINIVLNGIIEDIDGIIEELGGTTESELYLRIVNLLKNTPADVADFISTPVETEEVNIYHIDNYGSKMAPFYTVLACWVGCTLLVSIIRTDIKDTKKFGELKLYEEFFGRFMLFGIVAVLQGLIIAIGDIVLGVEVLNYPLFILTCMLSSLVFMILIYALVISFGKVGSALAVVVMVFQVAGSGGTFPIELLPRGFQILQPFMPFYPAMNALRETIGGFYGNEYLINIGLLLCHTILPLILGLVLRKPIKKIKEEVDESLEETHLIV